MGLETAAIIAAVASAVPALIGVGKMLFPPGGAGAGDVTAAGAKKMADMQKAASAYGAYRPDQADARMKAMQQQLSAYQGAGNIMQAMYGGSGTGGGGTYIPGSGGWKPGDPGFDPKTPDPNKTNPLPPGFDSMDQWLRWRAWADEQAAKKTADIKTGGGAFPGQVPIGTSPPIYTPPTTGGLGAGTSGTSLVDPKLLAQNPMYQSLMRNRG